MVTGIAFHSYSLTSVKNRILGLVFFAPDPYTVAWRACTQPNPGEHLNVIFPTHTPSLPSEGKLLIVVYGGQVVAYFYSSP